MKSYGFLTILLFVLFLCSCTFFLSKESTERSVKKSSVINKNVESSIDNWNFNKETKKYTSTYNIE